MGMSKTAKVAGLFIAAALAVGGCAADDNTYYDDDCYDENDDGSCEGSGSSTGRSYVDIDGKNKYNRHYTGVTSGSSGAKGGIGSSGFTSSG